MSTRVVLLVAALLACGCTTPQERYEDASKDESQGRWAAAAEKYIAVLREDPEYPEARARAKSAGDRAIAGWVEAASGLEEVERYDRALAEYQRTDRLLDKAAVVGVVLDPPADYADRRRGVNRKAAESALAAADRIAAEGNWNTASNAYLRVESRYELTSEQKQRAKSGRFEALLTGARVAVEAGKFDQADSLVTAALSVYGKSSPHSADALLMNTRIQQGRYDALVESARSEADAGHYQRAYGVVEKALAIFGAAANESASARELQERIVLEGTVQVAVTPVWKHETVVRHVPDGILPDLNGVLEDQHWAGAPMFTEVIDPRSVRRTLRRLHLARDVISDPQAGLVAQQLGADFTLVLYLVRCDHDANETPVSHAVPTSKGDPDEILVYENRTLAVTCHYRLVDPDGHVVAKGRSAAASERKLNHARYLGTNADILLLTRRQHKLLDRHRVDAVDRELEREVVRDLAKKIAQAGFHEISMRLP